MCVQISNYFDKRNPAITLWKTTTHDLLAGAIFYKKQLCQELSRISAFHYLILWLLSLQLYRRKEKGKSVKTSHINFQSTKESSSPWSSGGDNFYHGNDKKNKKIYDEKLETCFISNRKLKCKTVLFKKGRSVKEILDVK